MTRRYAVLYLRGDNGHPAFEGGWTARFEVSDGLGLLCRPAGESRAAPGMQQACQLQSGSIIGDQLTADASSMRMFEARSVCELVTREDQAVLLTPIRATSTLRTTIQGCNRNSSACVKEDGPRLRTRRERLFVNRLNIKTAPASVEVANESSYASNL